MILYLHVIGSLIIANHLCFLRGFFVRPSYHIMYRDSGVLACFALSSSGSVSLIIQFCGISMLYFMHIIWAASLYNNIFRVIILYYI
jgi:hypothetical protein